MRSPSTVILGANLAVPLIVSLLLAIFAWPVVHTAPNQLPIGFVTTPTLEQRLPRLLNQIREGGFDAHFYPDEAALRQAILKREVYGGMMIDPAKPEDYTAFTASAGSPSVAQLITSIGNLLASLLSAAGFENPRIQDLIPATTDDPRQAGIAGSALPLVISGAASGALLAFGLRRGRDRMLAMLLIALFTGFAITGVMQGGYKTLTGSYLTNSLAASLAIGAVVSFVGGLGSVLGVRGLGLGAATLLLLANPFSALNSAPEMLPGVWGTVGQWLPIGAFGTLMRSVAFFEGNGAAMPLLVLSIWLVVGLGLIWLGSRRASSTNPRGAVA